MSADFDRKEKPLVSFCAPWRWLEGYAEADSVCLEETCLEQLFHGLQMNLTEDMMAMSDTTSEISVGEEYEQSIAIRGPLQEDISSDEQTDKEGLTSDGDSDDGECKVLLFLTTWTGRSMTIEMEVSDTIGNVKEKISSKEGTPKSRQILMFAGQELEDHHTLKHYDIRSGASLDQRYKRYLKKKNYT